mgnify:CR=1 FL=1
MDRIRNTAVPHLPAQSPVFNIDSTGTLAIIDTMYQ